MSMPEHARLRQARLGAPGSRATVEHRIHISTAPLEPEWDAFLSATPGGHYAQTSLWAQIKAQQGWRSARVIATRGVCVVGGAQLLMRPLPLLGAVGYVPRGPLCARDAREVAGECLDALSRLARSHAVRYLVIQPPPGEEALVRHLTARGFRPSDVEVTPTATVLLDLRSDPDVLLARMKHKTRYNIRLAERKGVRVREGGADDLPLFHRLMAATAQRNGFHTYPEAHFRHIWQTLAPYGYARLFVAEVADEPASALFAIPFGDTVTYWRGAWSGEHGNHHPNEAMHWAAIRWARAQGYRWYDLDGLDASIAAALARGEPLDPRERSDAAFKLGFGGQAALFPGSYDYVFHPALRWLHGVLARRRGLLGRAEELVRGIRRLVL